MKCLVIACINETGIIKDLESIMDYYQFNMIESNNHFLVFCLCMLGIMFLLLYLFDGINNAMKSILNVYGKMPLFYFIVHFYLIHIIMFIIVFMQGYSARDLVFGFNFGRPKLGNHSGGGLIIIYLIWIGVVLLLYPLCKWYGNYKERHRNIKWLRYL